MAKAELAELSEDSAHEHAAGSSLRPTASLLQELQPPANYDVEPQPPHPWVIILLRWQLRLNAAFRELPMLQVGLMRLAFLTLYIVMSQDGHAEGSQSPTAEEDPAVLWLNTAGESPLRSTSTRLPPSNAMRSPSSVQNTSDHGGHDLEQPAETHSILQVSFGLIMVKHKVQQVARVHTNLRTLCCRQRLLT